MTLYTLVRHPGTPCAAIERVDVELDRDAHGGLRLAYRLLGDADSVIAQAPAPGAAPRRRDELWRHTCCELFVREASGTGYCEYNFAPCGDWAAYAFRDYRTGRSPLETPPPQITLERAPEALVLTVALPDRPLGTFDPSQRIGIACVIETAAGVAYWALAHAPGKPDFHDGRAFASTPALDRTAGAVR